MKTIDGECQEHDGLKNDDSDNCLFCVIDALRTRCLAAEADRDAFAQREWRHVEAYNATADALRAAGVDLDDTDDATTVARRIAELAAELDAYKRAKAENDERFQIERDEARLELNAVTAAMDNLARKLTETEAARDGLRATLATAQQELDVTRDAWQQAVKAGDLVRARLGAAVELVRSAYVDGYTGALVRFPVSEAWLAMNADAGKKDWMASNTRAAIAALKGE